MTLLAFGSLRAPHARSRFGAARALRLPATGGLQARSLPLRTRALRGLLS